MKILDIPFNTHPYVYVHGHFFRSITSNEIYGLIVRNIDNRCFATHRELLDTMEYLIETQYNVTLDNVFC